MLLQYLCRIYSINFRSMFYYIIKLLVFKTLFVSILTTLHRYAIVDIKI